MVLVKTIRRPDGASRGHANGGGQWELCPHFRRDASRPRSRNTSFKCNYCPRPRVRSITCTCGVLCTDPSWKTESTRWFLNLERHPRGSSQYCSPERSHV
jgi:hypothetical protein